jgi:hypothetical protein
MTMNFNELPEFKKDFKHLGKKYCSLPKDLDMFKKVLESVPLGTDKHFAILFQNELLKIAKARFFCEYLKGKAMRIIYAYCETKQEIVFIELYQKGEQQREDQQRIKDFLKTFI